MKRIALLFTLLLICLTLPALAWEVSPEYEGTVAYLLPDWKVLDGWHDGDRDVLLLVNPEGKKYLGFCTDAALTLTQPLPDDLFQITAARLFSDTAMLLMEDYRGTAYFVGCVYQGENWLTAPQEETGWVVQVSTPLPQGTTLSTKHATEGCIQLELPIRTDEIAFHGTMVDTEIRLVDGTWRVTGLMCPQLWMDFRTNGILGPECAWYGDVALETDVTHIDWAALPTDEEACLALLDMSQWRYLSKDTPALREHMNGMEAATDLYRQGTPVRIIRYSSDGSQVLAAVLGGRMRCWFPVEALADAQGQIAEDGYVVYINPMLWGTPTIEIKNAPAIPLYDTPDGEPLHTLAAGELHQLTFLADCAEEGWFHVEASWDGLDGYVHADDLPADEAIVVAKKLLPEYIFQMGAANEKHAAFIMTNPAGETVFVGCSSSEEGWIFTESQPLPEGSICDDYHSIGSTFILQFPHPEGVKSRWFEDEVVWIECVSYPQEDHRWLVETIHNENDEAFQINHVGATGYYITLTGMAYGTVTLERDMRYIDWSTFPMCLDDALAYLADDMGVIGADALPLYTDADCTQVIAEYLIATPVTILSLEGGMAQVRIADSDVVGWLDADGLLLGAAQLFLDEEGEWLTTAEYYANIFDAPEGTPVYDAPEGEILCTSQWPAWYTVMSTSVDGWYHICFPESMESGWVRAEDGKLVE